MASKSAQINAEIFNIGPALFEAVCEDVRLHATYAASAAEHAANQKQLERAVKAVLDDALPRTLDHRGLWQAIWPRIAYAGTRASKASAEIESMRRLVPLFQDLDHYDPQRYRFDPVEWSDFVDHWKDLLPVKSQQIQWLRHAKTHPAWNPSAHFAGARTTSEVWKILTRDEGAYPGLRFSAQSSKVLKYLAVADFLHRHQASGEGTPLTYYTLGAVFDDEHRTGKQWQEEREALDGMRTRLAGQVGTLTALHTMMDMGLKTIKPDRVMTYLFSQLGWLQTLPPSFSKAQVIAGYMRGHVIDEMTVRADVLAASLHKVGHTQAHRRLDIWLVKYGQEPEEAYGITRNLQDRGAGIRGLLARVQASQQALTSGAASLAAEEAGRLWPAGEFDPVDLAERQESGNEGRGKRRKSIVMSRDAAERLFVAQWREGHAKQPDVYPPGRPGLSNDDKESILRLIERGTGAEEAFLSVLLADELGDEASAI